MRSGFARLSAVTIAIAASRSAVAAIPTIYDLGIASGSTASRGYSVNDSGQVAVTSFQLFGQGTPGRYDGTAPGGTLVTFATPPGVTTAFSSAIDASGQVAGYTQGSTVAVPRHAFRYDGTPGAGGVLRDLGTLGGITSFANGINDLGQVTGDAQADPNSATASLFAFVYTGTPGAGGVMKSLGSLGPSGSDGAAINNAGQVAGAFTRADGKQHAFRYDGPAGAGVMRDLGVLPGFTESTAAGINASGEVVGVLDPQGATRAFVYKGTPGVDGVMTDLHTLPGGTLSNAVAINDAGYVLGFSDTSADGNAHFYPTVWRPDGSIIDIQAALDAANPAQGSLWDLRDSFITDISNTGFITGDGIYLGPGPDSGRGVAFVMDASSLLPEPASVELLFILGLTLARREPGQLR